MAADIAPRGGLPVAGFLYSPCDYTRRVMDAALRCQPPEYPAEYMLQAADDADRIAEWRASTGRPDGGFRAVARALRSLAPVFGPPAAQQPALPAAPRRPPLAPRPRGEAAVTPDMLLLALTQAGFDAEVGPTCAALHRAIDNCRGHLLRPAEIVAAIPLSLRVHAAAKLPRIAVALPDPFARAVLVDAARLITEGDVR